MKKKRFSLLLTIILMATSILPTSHAVSQFPTDPAQGLVMNSSVTPNEDGSYHVQLDSYVTSAHKPLDVVLVLDNSNNMGEPFGKTTRLSAMQQAASSLIQTLHKSYTDTYHHHIGIVTYSGSAHQVTPALTPLDSAETTQHLLDSIQQLGVSGDWFRHIDDAMSNASDLLSGPYSDGTTHSDEHQKVVIVLSSGKPKDSSYDFSYGIADRAISISQRMKQAGTLVYTIGLFEEANPSELYGSSGFHCNSDGSVGSHWCEYVMGTAPFPRDTPANNRFFNYLSSNTDSAYRLGLSADQWWGISHLGGYAGWRITQNFPCDPNAGYFRSAKTSDSLNEVFQDIVDKTLNAHVSLDSSSVLKEHITTYFEVLPNSAKSTIVAASKDIHFDETAVTPGPAVSVDGSILSVTDFDYNRHCVTATAKGDGSYGSKLVVEFDVKAKDTFFGGNELPLCGGASTGMFASGTDRIASLPIQSVSAQIQTPALDLTDQTIFLGESADLAHRIQIPSTVNGVNNAFVDLVWTLTANNATVGTYTIPAAQTSGRWAWADGQNSGMPALTETTTYEVTCSATPITGTSHASTSAAFTITVNSGTLEITHTSATPDIPFVLELYKDGAPYMTLSATDDQPITVIRLPKGTYTVQEDTNWTWRYTNASTVPNSVMVNADYPSNSIVLISTKSNPHWLNHYDVWEVQE